MEKKELYDEGEDQKKETSVVENKSEGEEDCLEAKRAFPETNEKKTSDSVEPVTTTSLDETLDVLKSYEMWCGNLDLGTWTWMNQETNTTTTSYSSSFSIEESNNNINVSMVESPSTQHHQLQQWVDSSTSTSTTVDSISSILSWDAFSSNIINPLEQDLFFFENTHLTYPPNL